MIDAKLLILGASVITLLVVIAVATGFFDSNDSNAILSAQLAWYVVNSLNTTYMIQGEINPTTLDNLKFEVHETSEYSLDDWLYVFDQGNVRVWWKNKVEQGDWHLVRDDLNITIPLNYDSSYLVNSASVSHTTEDDTNTQTSLTYFDHSTNQLYIKGYEIPFDVLSLQAKAIDFWWEPNTRDLEELKTPNVTNSESSGNRRQLESSSEYFSWIKDMDNAYYEELHTVENKIQIGNAYCFYRDLGNKCRITFRGSDDGDDWASNFDIFSTNFYTNFDFHRGFVDEFSKFTSQTNKLKTFIQRCNGRRLELVGHSLGGGLADVASVWVMNEYPNQMIDVITAGQPRPMLSDSIGNLKGLVSGNGHRKIRIGISGDLVTGVPYAWMGYTHMPYGCVYHCYFYLTLSGWKTDCDMYRGEDKNHDNFGYLKPWNHQMSEYLKFPNSLAKETQCTRYS